MLDAEEGNSLYVIEAGRELAFPTIAKSDKSAKQSRDKFVPSDSLHLWHRRLAHLNPVASKQILDYDDTIHYSDDHDHATCDICLKSQHQQEFNRRKIPRGSLGQVGSL